MKQYVNIILFKYCGQQLYIKKNQLSFSTFSFDPNITTSEVIRLEQDIFVPLASSGKLFVYDTKRFWSQIKSTG